MNANHLQIELPEAPQSIARLKDYKKVAEKLDVNQDFMHLSGSIQTKNDTLYLYINLYQSGKRAPLWVSTKLRVRGNVTKAKSLLADFITYIKVIAECKKEFYENHSEKLRMIEEDAGKDLFADVLLKWLAFKKDYVASSTYLSYKRELDIIEPYYREKKTYIQDMTGEDIDDFTEWQRSQGKKVETVKRYRAAVSGAIHYAMSELKLIRHDIVADSKRMQKPKSEIFTGNYYNEKELRILLDGIAHTKLELPIWLGGFYGLRRSEAIGLRWSQVDFENDTITIDFTVTPGLVDGKLTEIPQAYTKTDKSRRTLPLELPLKTILLRRQEEIVENRRMYGNCYNRKHSEFVCVDDFGNRIKLNYVSCAYPKLLEKLGLRRIRFHDLRHTSASMLIKAGQNLTDVMSWLGHSSFKTTQRYSHLEALSKKKSSVAMCNLLFEESKNEDEKMLE